MEEEERACVANSGPERSAKRGGTWVCTAAETARRATVALHHALRALYAAGGTSEEEAAPRPEACNGNVNANKPEEN